MTDEAVEERRVATVGAIVEVAVEFTDELLAERFENEDDDVLLVHGFGLRAPPLSERRIDGFEFLLVVKVVRVLVRVLADGAEEAERGVEHDGGFEGLGDILVGVAERDGADERSEAAAHAVDDEEDRRDKRNRITKVVREGGTRGNVGGTRGGLSYGIAVEEHEGGNEDDACKNHVPIVQSPVSDDATEVVVVLKLGEERHGGASAGELEVDGVAEVDDDRQGVDDDKNPLGDTLVGAVQSEAEGNEHEEEVEDVGV